MIVMSKKSKNNTKNGMNVRIGNNVSGQVAVGENIIQSKTDGHDFVNLNDDKTLRQLLNELRARVESETAPEMKNAALERVQELEQAVTEEKPDLSTMEYVKNWFGKNVPALAGAVTSVVVHPIVGKLVEAGGDLLVKDFQRRFGGAS